MDGGQQVGKGVAEGAFAGDYLRIAGGRRAVNTAFEFSGAYESFGVPAWPEDPTTSAAVVGEYDARQTPVGLTAAQTRLVPH